MVVRLLKLGCSYQTPARQPFQSGHNLLRQGVTKYQNAGIELGLRHPSSSLFPYKPNSVPVTIKTALIHNPVSPVDYN